MEQETTMALSIPKRQRANSSPPFLLTKSVQITILRASGAGQWVNGYFQKGLEETLVVEANVQPMRGHELIVLPEADRTKETIKVYTRDRLNTVQDVGQKQADVIIWEGKKFRAIQTQTYQMGVLDHTKTICVRYPETPDNMSAYTPVGTP